MKYILLAFFLTVSVPLLSQEEDPWKWWNDLHHWEPGMPGWRNFMILSPGFLGPNALPVPEMKRGFITRQSEVETTISRHFHSEDPTQDLSARIFLPAAGGRIAFEASWMFIENYHYTEKIRDERMSRDRNGMGFATGDVYLGAQIQLVRDKRFPNTLFRFAVKTASGDAWAARFTDTPGYYFDFSSSKDFKIDRYQSVRPYASLGFYSWQTYNQETPQNDALLYGIGAEYLTKHLLFSGNLTGYSGYLQNRDKPLVINLESRYDWERMAARILFTHGLRDWQYSTFRFSVIWKFDAL